MHVYLIALLESFEQVLGFIQGFCVAVWIGVGKIYFLLRASNVPEVVRPGDGAGSVRVDADVDTAVDALPFHVRGRPVDGSEALPEEFALVGHVADRKRHLLLLLDTFDREIKPSLVVSLGVVRETVCRYPNVVLVLAVSVRLAVLHVTGVEFGGKS